MNRYLGFIQQKLQCCNEGWDFFNKNCSSAATGNNREKRTAMMGESVTGQNDGENGWIQREFHLVQRLPVSFRFGYAREWNESEGEGYEDEQNQNSSLAICNDD
ncbi:hypothetical protein WN943_027140 [Citrus x changshan-huyou]